MTLNTTLYDWKGPIWVEWWAYRRLTICYLGCVYTHLIHIYSFAPPLISQLVSICNPTCWASWKEIKNDSSAWCHYFVSLFLSRRRPDIPIRHIWQNKISVGSKNILCMIHSRILIACGVSAAICNLHLPNPTNLVKRVVTRELATESFICGSTYIWAKSLVEFLWTIL